jgi:dTDP-4-dehydrorhamnose reductase
MMNLLILGRGYIGTALENALKKQHTVKTIQRKDVDYTDKNILHKFLGRNSFDLIINCSGYTGSPNVDGCEANKSDCWFYNVVAPHNVLLVADALKIPVFHVSSGCIYSGYEKDFTEQDEPNFGIYSTVSSYYSKCKHAFETISKNFNAYIFRIRMPFDGTVHRKNYLNKIYTYNNLISLKNSLTSVQDLCDCINKFLSIYKDVQPGPINIVNPEPLDAQFILQLFKQYNVVNQNWKLIELEDLNTVANRSNCVLDSSRLASLGLSLPSSYTSLERDVKAFATKVG